jgi:HlyD family secretion protein
MTRKAKGVIAACVLLLIAGSIGAFRLRNGKVEAPTAEVRKGEFIDYLQIRGEISAENSVIISAPMSAGDLQILKLAKNGSTVKKGDVVVQFDTTNVSQTLEQKRAELKSAEADIDRTRAQGRLDKEQKITDTLKAKYDVERAQLDASKQEILSEIDGAKAKLTLADSEQRLKESEERVKSAEVGEKADIESKKQKQKKVLFDIHLAERQVASMTVRAPVDGIVTISSNYRTRGETEFKEGDRAWAGAKIAELPDLRSIRIKARVDETDRGPLKKGQSVLIRIDAIPDREFNGTVSDISTIARPDFSGWPPVKNFDLVIGLTDSDARIRPGMNGNARIVLGRTEDAIIVPAEAVFQKSGKAVAYVISGRGFEERTITVGKRNSAEAMITAGLKPGERVALKDPTQENGK